MRIFLEEHELELKSSAPVAYTKQVNNIVSLGTRQANYTNTISVPRTARNQRIMKLLGQTGSTSRVPYIKTTAWMLDEDTSDWTVYKGWANITEIAGDDYKLYIYDGIIDFFKAIENKTLTDIGISGLNHIKNIDNVVGSFANDRPYMYIIADYNGKNLTSPIVTYPDDPTPDEPGDDAGDPVTTYAGGELNIDYMIPEFRMSYVWNQIFLFAGFTYSGSTFLTEKFLNWFATYPKPVPVNTPIVNIISSQISSISSYPVDYPVGGGVFLGEVQFATIFPSDFTTAEATNAGQLFTTILQDGAFRIRLDGTLSNTVLTNGLVNYILKDSAGVIKESGVIDAGANEEIIILALEGDQLFLSPQVTGSNSPAGYFPLTGSIHSYFDYVLGYDANFEEALIDFSATTFVNEVMQHFSLTMFPDPYSNNIEFLTLDEIIQNLDVVDWSNKQPVITDVKYKIGNYAQKNNYKYRYNDENANHNDGFISIDNVNLNDEVTVLSSAFYSPEKKKTNFLGLNFNVYKLWNKEVKDDGEVEYKDLDGRYYFMRAEGYTFPEPINIKSESLGTTESITFIQRESYYRLRLQEIIYDNYPTIKNVLNDAKLIEASFYLTAVDLAKFDFKRLIYVEQFSSYYIVNKIINYIKNKATKCELLEVDYYVEPDIIVIVPGTYITITDFTIDGCSIIITFDTDADIPTNIQVVGARALFGGIPGPDDLYDQTFNTSGPITITVSVGGFWEFRLYLNSEVFSLPIEVDNFIACVPDVPEPTPCDPTAVILTNVQRFNAGFPLPGDNGSMWSIEYALEGVEDVMTCVPVTLYIVINSVSMGMQTFTQVITFVSGYIAINLPGQPGAATITMTFTNSTGTSFVSNTFLYS